MARRISVGTWAVLGYQDHLVAGPYYQRKDAIYYALRKMFDVDKIKGRRDRDKAWKRAKRKWSYRLVRVTRFEIEEI